MSFSDFKKYFDKFEVCMLGPDSADVGDGGKAWDGRMEKAKWIYKATAGGCRNFLETFWTNPQFRYSGPSFCTTTPRKRPPLISHHPS